MLCPSSPSLYIKLLTKHLRDEGVDVKVLPWFGKQSPISLYSLSKGIREGYDTIHLHWMPFNWRWMMKYVRKKCGKSDIKTVWTVHNLIPHTPRYGTNRSDIRAMRDMANWANHGIVHSENIIDRFQESFNRSLPLSVIPHGHFIDYVERIPRDEAREALGIPKDKFVLLMFPPNRWNKGLRTFIEVLEKLPDNYIGIMAGKCTDIEIKSFFSDAKRKLNKRLIVRTAYIPAEEAHQFFGCADVFFMPYKDITTSGSVAHAISYAKPIVSTRRGNLGEMVEHGLNGYLCESQSEMAETILSITPEKAQEMGEKSFQKAKTFDWTDIAKRTIEVYERVAEC